MAATPRPRGRSSSPSRRIRLVALDVDGTLLDASCQVHPRVSAAILRARGQGIPVVLSTGRCAAAAFSLVNGGGQEPLIKDGGVFLGGAVVLDGRGELVSETLVPKEVVSSVLAYARSTDLAPVLIHGDVFRCVEPSRWTRWMVSVGDPPADAVGWDGLEAGAARVNLVCLMGRPETIAVAEEAIGKRLVGTEAQVVKPFDFMLDVIPRPSRLDMGGKAAGLAALCGKLSIPPESVMAVGDSGNDLDMLRWAGWAVAMGNATAPVVASSDAVVASNEDGQRPGVAEAIETFVLAE